MLDFPGWHIRWVAKEYGKNTRKHGENTVKNTVFLSYFHRVFSRPNVSTNLAYICQSAYVTQSRRCETSQGDAGALVLTKHSSYPRFATSVQYARGHLVCEAWSPSHTFDWTEPSAVRALKTNYSAFIGAERINVNTSHDYHCYTHSGSCVSGDCRDVDAPILAHSLRFEVM